MTTDELRRPHWLAAYEANVKNWLPSSGGGDHVSADPVFALLKQRGVFFYDETLSRSPLMPGASLPVPGGRIGSFYA